MDKFRIIGAGLAGLLAACKWPEATIYEQRSPNDGPNHKALLRFRSDAVSKLTNIPFREVRVDKAIWTGRELKSTASIPEANAYSQKVLGRVTGGRSIWNMCTERRWIAPEDFEQRLIDRHGDRIKWNSYVFSGDFIGDQTTISTIPMPAMMKLCGLYEEAAEFTSDKQRPIYVHRYRLPAGTDIFQTIYFPESNTPVYRASITGDMLIIEESSWHWGCTMEMPGIESMTDARRDVVALVLAAFGLGSMIGGAVEIDRKYQEFGKIIDLPKHIREAIMYELTRDYNVFSLGRFATWRNILLDDVVNDMEVIDRLMKANQYARHKITSFKRDDEENKIPF